jgi:hypothetical protein
LAVKEIVPGAFDGAITSRLPSRTMLTSAVFANPTRPKEKGRPKAAFKV